MLIGGVDTEERVVVIAEIGNNHGGDVDRARRQIDLAHEAGADVVKFQTYLPEHYVNRRDNEQRFKNLTRWQLSFDDFDCLARHAKGRGINFLSTPFDLQSARFLGGNSYVDAIKVSSGDNTFLPLIRICAETAKPMIISTGIANQPEIKIATDLVSSTWAGIATSPGLAILHCVTSYPVSPQDANLLAIRSLAASFPKLVAGYSDHTNSNRACVLAVALGARIIERHFTDDRNSTEGPDHHLSVDPLGMAELVATIRDLPSPALGVNPSKVEDSVLLGDGTIGMLGCEAQMMPLVRRSIVANADLDAGTVLCRNDITWVRPGNGLAPGREDLVLGRRLTRAIAHWEPIQPKDLAPR